MDADYKGERMLERAEEVNKFPENFINKIICGDCLELIKLISDNSIDGIITDPPYGLNKNSVRNDADLSIFYKVMPDLRKGKID